MKNNDSKVGTPHFHTVIPAMVSREWNDLQPDASSFRWVCSYVLQCKTTHHN